MPAVGPSPQYLESKTKEQTNIAKTPVTINATATSNFSTWGTGKPIGFGPDAFSWDPNNGWLWKGNQAEGISVVFIGDQTGKYIAETATTEGLTAGSPITLDSAIQKELQTRMAVPGGITALKNILADKQIYGSEKYAQTSLSAGDDADPYFMQALQDALIAATGTNTRLSAQGAKTILTLDDWLAQAPKTGMWESTSGGGSGGTKKTISRQKFQVEDYDVAIDELFQRTVGRGATEQELEDFVSRLQAFGDENPLVQVSKTSGKTTTQTQSGGVSSDAAMSMMKKEALANPEAEGYNKATKYLTYFMEALENPIQLGS